MQRCPAGEFRCAPQTSTLGQIIELDHGAVNVIGQIIPACINLLNRLANLIRPFTQRVRNDVKPPLTQIIQRLRMGGKSPPLLPAAN